MSGIILVIAGCLGMAVAVVHGYLGETRVVRPARHASGGAKRVMQAVMFLSALYWFAGGAALAAAPFVMEADARRWAVAIVVAAYLTGAAGNFWATRGRHFGWGALSVTAAIACLGGWLGA